MSPFHPNFSEEQTTYFASLPLPCSTGPNTILAKVTTAPQHQIHGRSSTLIEWMFRCAPQCCSRSLTTPPGPGSPVPARLFRAGFLVGPSWVPVGPALCPRPTAHHTPLLSGEPALLRAGAPEGLFHPSHFTLCTWLSHAASTWGYSQQSVSSHVLLHEGQESLVGKALL